MTDLHKAAQAVLDRWDSPSWEWHKHGHTADLMAELRAALAAQAQPEEPSAWRVGAAYWTKYASIPEALCVEAKPLYTRPEPDHWKAAVVDQCMLTEAVSPSGEPATVLRELIDWHLHADRELYRPKPAAVVPAWQPIETAPKDGTPVLVWPPTWTGGKASVAGWSPDRYAKKPRPYWIRSDDLGRVTHSRGKPPTHWMPLPADPDALSASPTTKAEVVPAGFVLVPVEPTQAYWDAVWKVVSADGLLRGSASLVQVKRMLDVLYAAMLSASPAAPAPDADALTVNLMRQAGLDKHKARECAEVVRQMLAAPAKEQGEPLFLLHIGDPFGGEPGEWETEANGHERVEEFCRQHPGQTVKLYADTQKDHP